MKCLLCKLTRIKLIKMNGALVMLGMAIVSIVFASVLVRQISSFCHPDGSINVGPHVQDQSSLNEDFRDILGFIPLDEVVGILQSFVKYDKQIGDVTVGYINDNARYIAREFNRMPEFQRFLSLLGNNGLDLEYWHNQIAKCWSDIPTYLKTDASVACGGLSSMVIKIVKTIPQEELHEFLRQKVRYSASFRRFCESLRSPSFEELCKAVEQSRVLQRHYFWANHDGVKVIFGIKLLKNLHTYLAYELS